MDNLFSEDVYQERSKCPAGEAETFTERGIDASLGRHGQPDRIAAHKWFNIAALSGAVDAVRLRRELALEMTADEIAMAQRLAREWLSQNKTAAA